MTIFTSRWIGSGIRLSRVLDTTVFVSSWLLSEEVIGNEFHLHPNNLTMIFIWFLLSAISSTGIFITAPYPYMNSEFFSRPYFMCPHFIKSPSKYTQKVPVQTGRFWEFQHSARCRHECRSTRKHCIKSQIDCD